MALSRAIIRGWSRLLWLPRTREMGRAKSVAIAVARVLTMTIQRFLQSRLPLHASDLSFYVALSIVPFLAFVMLILNVFQLSEVVQPMVLGLISAGNEEVIATLSTFIANAQGVAVSGVGVALLFGVGFMMLQRVKSSLNHIWGVRLTLRYSYRLVEYVVVLTVAPLVLAVTFSLTAFLNSLRVGDVLLQNWLVAEAYHWVIGYSSLPLFVLVLLYAYLFLPDTRVRFSAALAGAVCSAILIQIAQDLYIFGFFKLSAYNMIYGAFAILPFTMIWFYLAWTLFLFGAQLSCVIQNYSVLLATSTPGERNAIIRPYVLIAVLLEVARAFQETGKPARLNSLARQLGLSQGAAAEILRELAEAYLVTPVKDRRNSYVPAEHMDRLTVGEALERLMELPQFSEHLGISSMPRIGALGELFAETNAAMAAPLRALTISELMERSEGLAAAEKPAEPRSLSAGGASS